jgi:hypothetical protein
MEAAIPYVCNVTMQEALAAALRLSVDLAAETAIGYRRSEATQTQPLHTELKWAAVVVADCDPAAWVIADDVRFDCGHSDPDNPWQIHLKVFANPYHS